MISVMGNIPFANVPIELIEQLNSCDFTYEQYLEACPIYDDLPCYWNFALADDGVIIGFVYGTYEPLERFMHVIRCTLSKEARQKRSYLLDMVVECLCKVSDQMGATNVFFITDRDDIFRNKLGDKIKLSQGKVLEVVLNENLH